MRHTRGRFELIVAEDDEDDFALLESALDQAGIQPVSRRARDGEELISILRGLDGSVALVLLDLNMPRMDGRETLRRLKADPFLRSIPVVVLSTSKADDDVRRCYDLGGSGFITKPDTFQGFLMAARALVSYWRDLVRLPQRGGPP